MDEATWLSSIDPAAMLRHLTHEVHRAEDAIGDHPRTSPLISDRKLRLFACACCLMIGRAPWVVDGYEKNGAPCEDGLLDQLSDSAWAIAWTVHDMKKPSLADRAALLREIVGNPFSPATLSTRKCGRCGGHGYVGPGRVMGGPVVETCPDCRGTGSVEGDCPWLTEQVTALATAAYEDNGGKVCGACKGKRLPMQRCLICDNSGRVGVGTLDNDRLMILADALEDEGAPPDSEIVRHLRSTGPHVRGCHVLDAILGKS